MTAVHANKRAAKPSKNKDKKDTQCQSDFIEHFHLPNKNRLEAADTATSLGIENNRVSCVKAKDRQ